MTILFDARRTVKPTNFGRGLLRTLPTYRASHTASDAAWLVAENARRRAEDRELDRRFAEASALSRLEAGYCC